MIRPPLFLCTDKVVILGTAVCFRFVIIFWAALAVSSSALGASGNSDQEGVRFHELQVGKQSQVGFRALNIAGELTRFGNRIDTDLYRTNQVLLNGSGVSLADVNGDGKTDIFATRVQGANALLINQGQWKFESVANAGGAALGDAYSTGSVLADLDGDGDSDLLVATLLHGTRLYRNDGQGAFEEVTAEAGISPGLGGMSIAVGDYDRDGLPDFYVAHYRASALMDVPNARMNLGVRDGKKVITDFNGRSVSEPDLIHRFYVDERGGIGEYGELDHLYHNLGGLKFERVSFEDGTFLDEQGSPLQEPPYDWGLAAAFRDVNQDGLPDLYVCNDFDTPDRLWMNQGEGRFRAIDGKAMSQSSWFSMGVDFADVNRDGWDDFLTLDMLGSTHVARMTQLGDEAPPQHLLKDPTARPQFMKTQLFMNRGDGTYAEVGQYAGVDATDWAWCPAFLDVDLDGWEDLLVTNGNERDGRNLDVAAVLKRLRAERRMTDDEIFTERMRFPRLPSPNLAYRNNRDGTFTPMGESWGFDHRGVSNGMALGDLDGDGDLDVVVNHLNEPLGIYRNEASGRRVAIRLKGANANTAAVGARITVKTPTGTQAQEVMAGGRYLSSDEPMRVFGLGEYDGAFELEIRWPTGKVTTVSEAQGNRLYEISEPVDTPSPDPVPDEKQTPKPMFVDVSAMVDFTHHRQEFNDFERQPLILRRYSDWGPGVAWHDIDRDGFDDLIIGSGRGGKLGVYRNNAGTAFAVYDRPPFDRPLPRDVTSVLGVTLRPEDPAVILGQSNYEDGLSLGTSVSYLRFRGKTGITIQGEQASSVGPIAMADWDQDGDLDMFIGGRCLPGKIPATPESQLLTHNGQLWVPSENNSPALANVGLVSGATFSDIDGDHDPDLLLAMEWGAPEVFVNHQGHFVRATEEWGLTEYRGWWNGVHAGDFNADGKMDFVMTNWGLNSPYRRYRTEPLELHFGDLDGNQRFDGLLGAYDAKRGERVPDRQLGALANGILALNQLFENHASFAAGTTLQILDRLNGDAQTVSAGWFESTVFMNRGERFEAKALPAEAQYSPAFGVTVADFDADGVEDLFLAQNFFGVRNGVARYDAGRGLVLRGQGDGDFLPLSPSESGVAMIGEQRGAAVADLNQDGRVDLAVGQNGGRVKLYRNHSTQKGYPVFLAGFITNPTAVGASVWLSGKEGRGPRREISLGSGFLSQDAATQILTLAGEPDTLHVVWPDGKQSEHTVPAGEETRLMISYPQED